MLEKNQREECSGKLANDWTELEDADYFGDMETSSLKRKGRRGGAFCIPKSDKYDEDYIMFLEGLEKFRESKVMEDEDDDPLYLVFLDNLKEYRNAYKCDVSVEYGVLSPILYEEDSDDAVPVKRKPPKSHGGTHSGVKKKVVMNSSNARNGHSDGAKGKTTTSRGDSTFIKKKKLGKKWSSSQENSSAPKDFPDEDKKSSEVVSGLNHSKARNDQSDMFKGKTTTSRKGDCKRGNGSLHVKGDQRSSAVYSSFREQVSIEVDDTYKEFLNHLYVEAGFMIFKDGDRKKIIYESLDRQTTVDEFEPHETDIRSPASPALTLKEASPNPRPLKSPRRPPTTVSRAHETDIRSPTSPASTLKEGSPNPRPLKSPRRPPTTVSRPHETDIRSPASPASTLKEVSPNPRPLKSPRRPPTTVSRPHETDIISPASPALTLKEASPNPRPLKSPWRPSTTVSRPPPLTLEPSTSIPRPANPPSREKASTTTKSHLLSTSTCKTKAKSCERFSSFWKELHGYLRKPYKQKEYDDLMKQVSVRRPISSYRDSRSGGSERLGELGKSYLQYYPDLIDEMKKVESDRHKVLNLLRMFTVYLKKIPSGVPKPWLDDYTKTILPGSKLHGSN